MALYGDLRKVHASRRANGCGEDVKMALTGGL